MASLPCQSQTSVSGPKRTRPQVTRTSGSVPWTATGCLTLLFLPGHHTGYKGGPARLRREEPGLRDQVGPEPGALGGQRRRQDRRIDARDREHLRLAAGAGAPTTPKGCGGLEGQPRGRFWGGVEMGARTRVGAGGGEASPWLPGGQHRRRPAVAKENALPGHGRRVVESNGGREGPKAKRRGERARPRPWVRGSSVAAAAAEPERRVLPAAGCSQWL